MWSLRRTPSIHRNILVSVSFISLSSYLFIVQRSAPYDIVFIYFMLELDGYRRYFLDRMCLSESVSPFTSVSLCGAAGLAETFPFPPGSGPFLTDLPRFQAPSKGALPPQPRSSLRGASLPSSILKKVSVVMFLFHLFFSCTRTMSTFLLSDHRNRFH